MFSNLPVTYILELAGESLVLLSELGDEEAFLLLRRPLAVLCLLQQSSQALVNQNLTLLHFAERCCFDGNGDIKNWEITVILHSNSDTLRVHGDHSIYAPQQSYLRSHRDMAVQFWQIELIF